MFYLWGFTSAFVLYSALGKFFPAEETLIPATIHEDADVLSAVEYKDDSSHTPEEVGSGSTAEKGMTSTDYSL
jgi:NCS1 family nucleobase:cation symporter-1